MVPRGTTPRRNGPGIPCALGRCPPLPTCVIADVPRETSAPDQATRLQFPGLDPRSDSPTLFMPRVLCLGMSAHDAIYRVPVIPHIPTKVLATGYTECGGGMAASASVAVSRLGGDAVYWGRVGDDPLGERILRELAGE